MREGLVDDDNTTLEKGECMRVHEIFAVLGTTAAASLAVLGAGHAAEAISPLQPGATTGVPNAALPPPGLYLNFDVDYAWGKMRNADGDVSHIPGDNNPDVRASNVEVVGSLMWVPGWQFLGASYAAIIAQPFKFANTEITDSLAADKWSANGMVGTVVSPLNLSWNLGNGWFVGTGVSVVTPTGTTETTWSAAQNKYILGKGNIANNYWTFEPSFAVTWMKDGWMVSVNNVLDFNTKNQDTDYLTGKIYYLDATVAKRFDKFNVGVIANYTKQLEEDEQFGAKLSDTKIEHVKVGPMLSYDFDRFTVTGRYLQAVHTRNDVGISFAHVGVSMKLY